MKKIIILLFLNFGFLVFIQAQVSGNHNYTHQKTYLNNQLPPQMLSNNQNQITIRVRGIYNEMDTRQVAYFSITQLGENIDTVNSRMEVRIRDVETKVKAAISGVGFHVDMISFVPMYQYETVKRIFSRRTYNEVPAGFELKKNLHIAYSNHQDLDTIIAICARNEIYDLIKVEYISKDLEAVQDSLRNKALAMYQSNLEFQEKILGVDFSEKKNI